MTELIENCLASTATEWGSSRWSEFRRCQRAHDLKYVIGLERKPVDVDDDDDDRNTRVDYFAVGQLVHACLQYTSEGAKNGNRVSWRDVINAAGTDAGERKAFDIGVIYEAERLVAAYFTHYGEENGGWPEGVKVLDTEIEMGGPPRQRRADAVLELPSGEIVVADTKTRAHSIPDYRARFIEDCQVNDQFLGLSSLAQAHYKLESPPSIWVNAIIKTKVPKFDRVLVPMYPDVVERWCKDQDQWEAAYRLADRRNEIPLANYSACAPPIGSRCWAFYYCHGSEQKREQLFQVKVKQ